MLFDLAGAVIPLADAGSAATVKASLIGGVALVLGATLPIVLGKREKEPRVVADLRKSQAMLLASVTKERDNLQKTVNVMTAGLALRDNEINRLRELCVNSKPPINPFVGMVQDPENPI